MASIIYFSPCCLPSCCIFKHCTMISGFNYLNFPLLPAILLYFDRYMAKELSASITQIFPRLPAILFYFQTLPNRWWLQLLKYSPVACNLVVFRCMAKKTVGFNNLNFPPLPAILLYFQTLHNSWWLAWNLAVFSHMAK